MLLIRLIKNKNFQLGLTAMATIAIGLTIYETYQSIKLNNDKLEKLEQ